MKIGLFFGSFNPVHIGHLIIASFVANNTEVQQVWMIVSPQNPLKLSNNILNEYHRYHLVNLAIEDDDKIKVSDIEFKLPKPSYTIDTLIYLKEKYPHHDFIIVMGSDSFKNLPKWKGFELLIRDYSFIILQRPGFEIIEHLKPHITILKAPLIEISATNIRNLIKDGKSIRYMVPEKVRIEIEQNGYYKRKRL